jgi:ATP-dependent Clp protease ATP-binding subunit ClpX
MEENMSKEYRDDEYEKICYICRRPESKTGKMIVMPGNICVCPDCMQKTFDTVNATDFSNLNLAGLGQMADMEMFNKMWGNPQEAKQEDKELQENEAAAASEGEDAPEVQETEEKKTQNPGGVNGFPNISFLNLADFPGMGTRQKVKKRAKGEKKEPPIDINKVLPPHKIKEKLDEYVIGQEQAKKAISVAVYNHYKRIVRQQENEDVEIEKSNMLMIGPTGCGKTYLVKTLAKILDVPLAIADATSLTEAGYIGDDIESVVSKLLAAADNDVDRAEVGIIFIDEIDKLARKRNTTTRDINGEAVQQGLLKVLEGSDVEVPVGANSKNAMVPLTTVNTKNILFICGGAFPELDEIIKQRLNTESSIGFKADLKDKYDKQDVLEKVTVEDIRNFGMIPEFIGRLPILFTLKELDRDMMVQVLKEPKNAILKQYQKLLELDEVDLEFDEGAMQAIAEKALEKKTGARALRAVLEEYMLDIINDGNDIYAVYEKEELDKGNSAIILKKSEDKGQTWSGEIELLPAEADQEPAVFCKKGNEFVLYYSSDILNKGESYMGAAIYYAIYDSEFNIIKKNQAVASETPKGILLYDILKADGYSYMLYAQDYLTTNDLIIERVDNSLLSE